MAGKFVLVDGWHSTLSLVWALIILLKTLSVLVNKLFTMWDSQGDYNCSLLAGFPLQLKESCRLSFLGLPFLRLRLETGTLLLVLFTITYTSHQVNQYSRKWKWLIPLGKEQQHVTLGVNTYTIHCRVI